MDTAAFHRQLVSLVGDRRVLRDELMSAHTTFRVGGPADWFVSPTNVEDLKSLLTLCRENDVRTYVMGRGSNLLVCDEGLRGVVVQIANAMAATKIQDNVITVQAGASNSKVASIACREGLTGYEFAAGIPGTIGGAAIMNAGAYGGEFKQVATSVTCLTRDLDVVEVGADQADWSYRHSRMGDEGMIVLSAALQLQPGDPDEIQARMDELAAKRSEKQPLDMPSAGSTFKRPPGHFAGKLIQDAGLQGYAVGGAMVSTKHAGFVVNTGNATAADVYQLIKDVQARVLAESDVTLTPEVRLWGFEE